MLCNRMPTIQARNKCVKFHVDEEVETFTSLSRVFVRFISKTSCPRSNCLLGIVTRITAAYKAPHSTAPDGLTHLHSPKNARMQQCNNATMQQCRGGTGRLSICRGTIPRMQEGKNAMGSRVPGCLGVFCRHVARSGQLGSHRAPLFWIAQFFAAFLGNRAFSTISCLIGLPVSGRQICLNLRALKSRGHN